MIATLDTSQKLTTRKSGYKIYKPSIDTGIIRLVLPQVIPGWYVLQYQYNIPRLYIPYIIPNFTILAITY